MWNGRRPQDMPEDVAALWRSGGETGQNISCMVLDPVGKLLKAFWPLVGHAPGDRPKPGAGDPFDAGRLSKHLIEQVERATAGMEKPAAPKKTLSLPTNEGRGVRMLFTLTTAQRGPSNYRAPVVEAAPFTEAQRKALAHPAAPREIAATDLESWLQQLYPPAIMDSSGEPPAVSGTLKLSAIDAQRALLKGTVKLRMDDRARTDYVLALEGLVTYGRDWPSVRIVYEGTYPKSGPPDSRPIEYTLRGVLESTPE